MPTKDSTVIAVRVPNTVKKDVTKIAGLQGVTVNRCLKNMIQNFLETSNVEVEAIIAKRK